MSKLLKALACGNNGWPPIWLMRQAGRYLPEYRDLRKKHSFLEMCHEPELISDVTLMPLKRFELDAAIIFSDILIIPEAMGLGLRFEDKRGPILERPLKTAQEVNRLPRKAETGAFDFLTAGIKRVKKELKVPLIGFCGAPFTLASYMIEGGSSRDLKQTKRWIFSDPESFHELLELLAEWCADLLNRQIKAGVQAVQIFDSWANFLAYPQFQEFSLRYLRSIKQKLSNPLIPLIFFCKGSSVFAPLLAEAWPSAISVDWNADLGLLRKSSVPYPIALQGNLDPDILYAPPPIIKHEANRLLDSMKGDKGFIFNLGHGMLPDIPLESVYTLVGCVKMREECLQE